MRIDPDRLVLIGSDSMSSHPLRRVPVRRNAASLEVVERLVARQWTT